MVITSSPLPHKRTVPNATKNRLCTYTSQLNCVITCAKSYKNCIDKLLISTSMLYTVHLQLHKLHQVQVNENTQHNCIYTWRIMHRWERHLYMKCAGIMHSGTFKLRVMNASGLREHCSVFCLYVRVCMCLFMR